MDVAASRELWQQVTGTQPDEAARGLIVHFSLESEMDEKASDEQGRPVFTEHEYIEIRSPNDPLSVVHRRTNSDDKRNFPQLYKAFKDGAADPLTGTPLTEWAPMAKSQAQQLAIHGVRSVEQFADISDDGCHRMGHGMLTLRNKAQAWLLKAKDASEVTKMAALLTQKDNQIQTLQRQITDLASRMDAKEEQTSKRKKESA